MRGWRQTARRGMASGLVGIVISTLWLAAPPIVLGLQWDGTNPGGTACGNGSQTIYTLGTRNSSSPNGSQGIPTNIYYGSQVIGTVEIRHSAYCATVWSLVTNLTSSSVQAHETIVLYSDSNGNGRTEYQYPTTDTLGAYGSGTYRGWSNQYRDRASFSAKGGIYYAGAWRWAETARSVAWVQDDGSFADQPYACDHSSGHQCHRWPVASPGVSATYHYGIGTGVYSMPNGSGGTVDVSGDVQYMFGQFNAVPAPNPFMNQIAYRSADVFIDAAALNPGIPAQTWRYADSNGYYYSGTIQLSTNATWASSSSNRGLLCHEIDHLMGMHHVWWHDSNNIDNVGSKATCIGAGIPTGPSTDDVSALNAIYTGVVP